MARVTLQQLLQINQELARRELGIPRGGQMAAPPPQPPGLLGGPLRRGALTVGADLSSAAGLASQGLGFDELSQGLYEKSQEYEHARDAIPRRIPRVEDISSAKDLGVFAIETLAENAPLLASIAIPGGVAAKAAALAGAGRTGASLTGALTGFLSDVGLQTGESVSIAREAGQDPADIRVVGSGIAKGALDFVPLLTIAKRIGLLKGLPLGPVIERELSKRLVEGGFISRAVGEAGTIVAREVPTETAQEMLNIALDRSLQQFEGQLTDEEKSQLLNAAAGAAAFGLLGIPAAVFSPRTAREQAVREATEDELNIPGAASGEQPLLEGPGRQLALPAPEEPPLFVDPEGNVTPYLPGPPSEELRGAVREALGVEPQPEPVFVFNSQGEGRLEFGPDVLTETAQLVQSTPAVDRSTIDNAILAIEGVRQQDERRATKSPTAHAATRETSAVPSALQKLLNLRDELLSDTALRRKRDGELNARGKKKVASIESRIAALSTRMGVSNPLEYYEILESDNIETEIQEVDRQFEERNEGDRLTPAERNLLSTLQEKELFDGLSDREYDTVAGLLAKARGEVEAERERRTPAQIRKEQRELQALAREEEEANDPRTQPKLSSKIVDIRTILEQKRKNRELAQRVRERKEAAAVRAERSVHDKLIRRELQAQKDARRGFRRLFQWSEDFDAMPGELAAWYGAENPDQALLGIKQNEQGLWQPLLPGGEEFGLAWPTKSEAMEHAEAMLEDVRLSIKEVADSEGRGTLSIARVTEIANKLMANMTNRPNLVVMQSTQAFRNDPVKRSAAKHDPNTTAGMFFPSDPDAIYIFAHPMRSEEEVQRTVLHEVFHRGLQSFMTERERTQLLDLIARSRPEIFRELQENNPELLQGAAQGDLEARRALQQQALLEAEEFVARFAEGNPRDSLLDRIIAFFRRVLRRAFPSLKVKFSDEEMRVLVSEVGAYGRKSAAVTGRNRRSLSQPFRRKEFLRETGRSQQIIEDVIPGIESNATVWGQKYLNGILTPLQIAKRAGRDPGLKPVAAPVTTYLELVQRWWARKRRLTLTPVSLAESWSKFSKRDSEKIAKVLIEVQDESHRLERRLEAKEVREIMKRNGLDPEKIPARGDRNVFALWEGIDESFRDVIDQMQKGLERTTILQATRNVAETERLVELWRSDPGHKAFIKEVATGPLSAFHLGARLSRIENEMNQLRQRNYFPLMRFGQWAITIRTKKDRIADGRQLKAGEIVSFETHSSVPEGRTRAEELAKSRFGNTDEYSIQLTKLADNEFAFLGMPPSLYETLKGQLNLTPEQEERLKEIYFKFSPGRSFLRHLVKREGIAGFSTDAMRVYASYMMNAANHLARVEYSQEMSDAVNDIRKGAREAPDSRRAGVLRDYLADHYNYLMNPKNDWARLRALGFLWYLGANVKSALVNLTQVPMVAFPYFSASYGERASFAAIAKAYKDAGRIGKGVLDPAVDADISRAVAEGFIDEALATELAGIAEGDILNVMAPEGASARVINRTSYYGAFLFRTAEKFNRITTFLAARDLGRQKGLQGEELYKAARDAVQTTMFEYAKWNRPQFMRGRKSVFFLFWQYMQHLSFIAYGGEGSKVAMRTWLTLMAAAGAQGLPFAENFFDIFDWGATEVKELFGVADPRTAVRENIRELATTITDKPDLIMHGLSRYYGLGPMHFLSLFDVPVPEVDISGSLGTGEILPGLSEAFSAERDPDKKMGRVLIDALGPVVGVGYNLWRVLGDDNPDTWKRWERALPSAAQSVSKAFRRGQRGEESFRGGGAVVEFEPQNMEHRVENIMQAFGFAPTRLNQRQELRYSQEQLRQYWTTRRAVLMESYAYAVLGNDAEAMNRALKKIREFNSSVPARQLGIDQDSLRNSITQRYRRRFLREAGIPNERAFVPLYRRIEQLFPEGSAAAPR